MYNDWYNLYLQQQETNQNLESIEAKIDNLTEYVESGDIYLQRLNASIDYNLTILQYLLTILLLWVVCFGLIRK